MRPRILLFGALVLAATAASAQQRESRTRSSARAGSDTTSQRALPTGAYSVSRGPACQPWCPADLNPCDPPEFKVTDGRCSYRD